MNEGEKRLNSRVNHLYPLIGDSGRADSAEFTGEKPYSRLLIEELMTGEPVMNIGCKASTGGEAARKVENTYNGIDMASFRSPKED